MGEDPPAATVPLSTERLIVHRRGPDADRDGWALCRRADRRVVGRLRVGHAPAANGIVIGWEVTSGWQDRGYAEEAVSAAAGYAVDVLGASRVTALVAPGDREARRVACRAGLARAGSRRIGGRELEVFALDVAPVDPGSASVREATAEEVVGLRQRVLRPHQPPSALLDAAADPAAVDLATVTPSGRVVACARVCRETPPWTAPAAEWWRLRNMATSAQARGAGLGRRLVDAALQRARAAGAERVWCAARTESAGFYTRCGFEPMTDAWNDPELGPHVGMARPA